MSKKPPSKPLMDEYADTPYITRNRELNTSSYNDLNTALDNFRNWENNNALWQSVADQYTQSQWNDLNRGYQQALNQNAARERQRLGTSGATSSLYHTDSLQRQYNDLASRLASNTASVYQDLLNNEYKRRAGTADFYDKLFQQTGNTTEAVDRANWQIRNQNKYTDWQNDMNDYQSSGWNRFTSGLKGLLGGGASGFASTGNLTGGLLGGLAGGLGGALTPDSIGGNESMRFGSALGSLIGTGYNTAKDKLADIAGGLTGGMGDLSEISSPSYSDWLAGEGYRSGMGNYGLNTQNLSDLLSNSELARILGGY